MKSFLHDVLGWLVLVACTTALIWNFWARYDEAIKNEPELPNITQTNTAVASYYAHAYHGKLMANGKPYDMHRLTFAHKTMPFGTRVRFERITRMPENQAFHRKGVAFGCSLIKLEVIGTCTDRGPYIAGRMFDLSLAMAESLGLTERGVDAIQFTIIE